MSFHFVFDCFVVVFVVVVVFKLILMFLSV